MSDTQQRFQQYLSLMRKTAGWTTTELAQRLGVTRQMVSNMEKSGTVLTTMQYRALRDTFNEAIAENPEKTKVLQDIMMVLVDGPDTGNFTPEMQQKVFQDATIIADAMKDEATQKTATKSWVTALAGAALGGLAAVALPAIVSTTAAVIAASKLLKDKDFEDPEENAKDNKALPRGK